MQGDNLYTAPNPPFGAVFTVYLKDEIKTKKKQRQEAETASIKKGEEISYPSWEALRAEDREDDPTLVLTVSDEEGQVVRRLTAPAKAGLQRVAWDLRLPPSSPTELKPPPTDNLWSDPPVGPMLAPGQYTVRLSKVVAGQETPLGSPQTFATVPLGAASLPAKDRAALLAFQKKTGRLQRAVLGAGKSLEEARGRLTHIRKSLHDTPGADGRLVQEALALEARARDLDLELNGDSTRGTRNEPTPPSITDRVQGIVAGHWGATSDPTATHQRAYDLAAAQFARTLESIRTLVAVDLRRLEEQAEAAGAPWTPGRVPAWRPE